MPLRIVATLAKLLERFDPEQFRLRESASDPVVPFEHEYPGKAGLFWVRHEHIGGRVLSRLPAPGAKALAISPKTETD